MSMEKLYLGHNNTIDLIAKLNDAAQDISGATKITATFDDTTFSSEDHDTGCILWDNDGYVTGELRLDLGDEDIDAGEYDVPVVVYASSYTDGLMWGRVTIQVIAEVEAS